MNAKQARTNIRNALSAQLGFKVSCDYPIDNIYVIGVKTNQINANDAAKIINENYSKLCTNAFNQAD